MVGRENQLKYYQLKTWKHYQNHTKLLAVVENNVVEDVNVLKTMFCVLSFANTNVFLRRNHSFLVRNFRRFCGNSPNILQKLFVRNSIWKVLYFTRCYLYSCHIFQKHSFRKFNLFLCLNFGFLIIYWGLKVKWFFQSCWKHS